jgi:hypothetical protein
MLIKPVLVFFVLFGRITYRLKAVSFSFKVVIFSVIIQLCIFR